MSFIFTLVFIVAAVYCSFKLAKEKGQNHIIWPVLTAFIGPLVFIVQYLTTIFINKDIA